MAEKLPLKTIPLDTSLPDWSLDSIFSEDVPTLNSYLGKPLLIVFFSLGCPGCLGRAIPYANRVVYENGTLINVVGIHSDFHHHGYEYDAFAKAKEDLYIRFPFFKDRQYDMTFKNYGAAGTPHWILLDAYGKVKYSIFGSDPDNALLKLDYKIAEILI